MPAGENYVEGIKISATYRSECGEYKIEILEINQHTYIDYHIHGHYATTQNAVAHIAENDSEQIVGQTYAKQYETALGA